MKKVLIFLLALVLVLGVTACDKDKTEEYSSLYGFSTDPVVDRFAHDYTKGGDFAMDDLTPIAGGKSITATLSGVTMTAYADGDNLHFILEGGMTTDTRDTLLKVFANLVEVTDTACTGEDLDKATQHLKEQKKLIMGYKAGGHTTVETYSPAMKDGEVTTNYRLTFAVKGYGERLTNMA